MVPKFVVELELTKLVDSPRVDGRFGGVYALVTFKGVPLCVFDLPCTPATRMISAETLRKEAVRRSAPMLWQKAIERSFAKSPHSCFPPLSVVVCTRDRARLLEQCLKSLRGLDYPQYEVVVVDNGSRDPRVAEVIGRSGFRNIREDRIGLNWARNRGAEEARHDIICYIDDDSMASAGWLRAIASRFEDQTAMAVTGLVLPRELDTEAQLLFERYGGMGKGMIPRSFNAATLPEAGIVAVHNFGVGTNMSFRREVFERVGGFDTMLDVGTPSMGAGDLDMFHRVVAAGLTLKYEPSALVWHRHRRSHASLRQQIYANGRSYGVYLIKRWRADRKLRTARSAVRWMGGWVMRRFVSCLIGREDFPLDLRWAELQGALSAPWAYLATMRSDNRIRQEHGSMNVRRDPPEGLADAPIPQPSREELRSCGDRCGADEVIESERR